MNKILSTLVATERRKNALTVGVCAVLISGGSAAGLSYSASASDTGVSSLIIHDHADPAPYSPDALSTAVSGSGGSLASN